MRNNPYYEEDNSGCFFIFNDDGTPAMSSTGQRYCFSEAKAEQIVERLNSQTRSTSSRTSRKTSSSAPATRQKTDKSAQSKKRRAPAASVPAHGFTVGTILKSESGFYMVVDATDEEVTLQQTGNKRVNLGSGEFGFVPDTRVTRDKPFTRLVEFSSRSGTPLVVIEHKDTAFRWKGQPNIPSMD